MFRSLAPAPLIDLGDVTLVTVTGIRVDEAQLALQRSMARLRFRRALLISSAPASEPDPRIEHVAIPPMTLSGYNRFVINELHRYIETAHALVIQYDGYVINPRLWDPSWLDYDYIGAPWTPAYVVEGVTKTYRNLVGNGGFSLRSRRLMQACAHADVTSVPGPLSAEDVFICNVLFDELTTKGMRFPTPEIAARFSIETPGATYGQTLRTSFGFHGRHFRRLLVPFWRRPWFEPEKAEGPDEPGPSRKL